MQRFKCVHTICLIIHLFSRFMDKRLSIKLNGGRNIQGVLRGFDPFMNLVVDDSVEVLKTSERKHIGMVVSCSFSYSLGKPFKS